MIIELNFIYISGCLFGCQTAYGPTLRNKLYAIPVAVFDFTSVPISLNGAVITVPEIQFLNISYVSAICKILFKKFYRYSLDFSAWFRFG